MSTASLHERYPWYQKHKMAVDTIVACLQIDEEIVLENLDKKLGQIQIIEQEEAAEAA